MGRCRLAAIVASSVLGGMLALPPSHSALVAPQPLWRQTWVPISTMEAPQAAYIHVQFDCDANSWQLFHTLTEERVCLPAGSAEWQCHVDDDQAVCLIRGGEALWVNQVLSVTVLQDDAKQFFVLSGDENDEVMCTLQRYHERHRDDSLDMTVPSGACSLSFSKFEVPWGGCSFYWHLGSLWQAARVDSPMRVSQWLESWWP